MDKADICEDLLILEQPDLGVQNVAFEHIATPNQPTTAEVKYPPLQRKPYTTDLERWVKVTWVVGVSTSTFKEKCPNSILEKHSSERGIGWACCISRPCGF